MLPVKELAAKSANDINLYLLSLQVSEILEVQTNCEIEIKELREEVDSLMDYVEHTDEGKYYRYGDKINTLQDDISDYEYVCEACEQCIDVIQNC